MIRHTPSFLISIIIHSLLLVAFFYTYTYVSSLNSDKKDEELCLKLTCIVEKHKEHVKEKPEPKKIIPPKPKPKVEKPKKEVVEWSSGHVDFLNMKHWEKTAQHQERLANQHRAQWQQPAYGGLGSLLGGI